MAATSKINVSVPHVFVEAARRQSGGNLSAYVTRALREQLVRDGLRMLTEDGHDGLSDDILAAMEEDQQDRNRRVA
jgi:hypothetical protein